LFCDNSIAMLGNSLSIHNFYKRKLKNKIYCLDNDNKVETLDKMEKLIDIGEELVIWPDNIKEKDVNVMVVNGYEKKEIEEIINKNTYSGFEAKVKLNLLKLKKRGLN